MRIAICGTHATDKLTRVDELAGSLDGFVALPEGYYLLEDEGHVFADRRPKRICAYLVFVVCPPMSLS